MTTLETTTVPDSEAQRLSEALADVFRTGDAGDTLTDDVFLDGHPPLWRFQLQGRDTFAAWIADYVGDGAYVDVATVEPTASGFVTQFQSCHHDDGVEITDRKILLCEVHDGRVSAMTVYCNGDWDPELRARHAEETTLIRP